MMPSYLFQISDLVHQSWWHLVVVILIMGLILYHILLSLITWLLKRREIQKKQKQALSQLDLIMNKKSIQSGSNWLSNFKHQINGRQKLVSQLPLFLQILQSTLRAGYSLTQSFVFAGREIPEPLAKPVAQLNQDLALQIPTQTALKSFAQSINHPEIDFFTRATCIQIQTGGNLVTLFGKLSHIIEEKLKLQRDIKSFTSQGKMSGLLIAGLWPCSLLIFWWLSPSHVEVLFTTSIGNFLLVLSIILEVIGFWMIWKIINIKL
ncbi:MAG TPA: type II secretion system F family protein [Candidatus Gracilibacteria bacterium]